MGANNVQNRTMLLRTVPDELRGRVFTAMEAIMSVTMLVSMALASVATAHYSPRVIGFVAGVASTLSGVPWMWMTLTGRMPQPKQS
jgi:hypothetical protein